ncbi:MAG: hypothetical protein WC284_12555 [Candidimonas sp.]
MTNDYKKTTTSFQQWGERLFVDRLSFIADLSGPSDNNSISRDWKIKICGRTTLMLQNTKGDFVDIKFSDDYNERTIDYVPHDWPINFAFCGKHLDQIYFVSKKQINQSPPLGDYELFAEWVKNFNLLGCHEWSSDEWLLWDMTYRI